jgi:hypothetical protein
MQETVVTRSVKQDTSPTAFDRHRGCLCQQGTLLVAEVVTAGAVTMAIKNNTKTERERARCPSGCGMSWKDMQDDLIDHEPNLQASSKCSPYTVLCD